MSICAYVWYKSYKSQATHSVGALWKVLVLSCFIPVMVSPTREETDSTTFPTFLVVKSKTSLNSAELNFPKFRELSWEGWRWKAWVGPRAFIPPYKNVEANVELKKNKKNPTTLNTSILLSMATFLRHSLSFLLSPWILLWQIQSQWNSHKNKEALKKTKTSSN